MSRLNDDQVVQEMNKMVSSPNTGRFHQAGGSGKGPRNKN
jgi:hypothetical protein